MSIKFTPPAESQITMDDLNKCRTCACDKICNHGKFRYEDCDSYIPKWISSRIALPENDRYVLVLSPDSVTGAEVVYFATKSPYIDNWAERFPYWMPIPHFGVIV